MPQYNYRCNACSKEHELIQTMVEGDQYLKGNFKCPHCESTEGGIRLIGKTSFKLSGGGWFAQGYDK